MRGALGNWPDTVGVKGIIPAYAGSTAQRIRHDAAERDHPRVCGEHDGEGRWVKSIRGSSPRMRGAPAASCFPHGDHGIIPAYAGSTSMISRKTACTRDHPRVCGEHGRSHSRGVVASGSSPRMRGAPFNPCRWDEHVGIIPAYAGSTSASDGDFPSGWDHPRVCGEHSFTAHVRWNQQGSSPRMRGAHCDSRRLHCLAGIIPAYAGSTAALP